MCLSKAGLKIGDSAATGFGTAAPNGAGVDYAIEGILYHYADSATNVPFDAYDAQGLLTSCLYLICLDSGGNALTVMGTPVLSADLAAGIAVLEWPVTPEGYCAIGAIRIDTTTSYNFTPGTTALSATGVTDTYFDLYAVPVTPLTA